MLMEMQSIFAVDHPKLLARTILAINARREQELYDQAGGVSTFAEYVIRREWAEEITAACRSMIDDMSRVTNVLLEAQMEQVRVEPGGGALRVLPWE